MTKEEKIKMFEELKRLQSATLQCKVTEYVLLHKILKSATVVNCHQHNQSYKGYISWRDVLRERIRKAHDELKRLGLCRKHFDNALRELKKEEKENEEKI